MSEVELIFFDIGGVLGSNGWDREQRAGAIERFHIDAEDFEYRHYDAVGLWETGQMTIDDYLDVTVFHEPRNFTRDAFREFMFAQSKADPDMVALARSLADMGKFRLMTFNNESAELNKLRIDNFGLSGIFEAFITSCYIGARKPTLSMYTKALGIAHAEAPRTLLIDDREQNLEPARLLGQQVIRFTNRDALLQELEKLGIAPQAQSQSDAQSHAISE